MTYGPGGSSGRPIDRTVAGKLGALVHPVRTDGELRIEPLSDLCDAASEWDRLAEASGTPFATREWATAWWDAFGAGRRLMSFSCRRPDGRLAALLPLREASVELRFVGHRDADVLGPICAPPDRPAVAAAVRRVLRDVRSHYEVFVGDDLPVRARWGTQIGAERRARTSSPVLRAEGWQAFLARRSANFRQQVRRRERRLERELGLRFRVCEDPSRLDTDLDTLFRLHAARWGEQRAFAGRTAAFHRAFAAAALRRGWLRLWIAELSGMPAAAWYGFRYAGVEWYYQAGRDPRFDRLAVGFVLLAHTIRAAFDDGIREYRLLRGDEPYKARFANGDDPVETVALASGDA